MVFIRADVVGAPLGPGNAVEVFGHRRDGGAGVFAGRDRLQMVIIAGTVHKFRILLNNVMRAARSGIARPRHTAIIVVIPNRN